MYADIIKLRAYQKIGVSRREFTHVRRPSSLHPQAQWVLVVEKLHSQDPKVPEHVLYHHISLLAHLWKIVSHSPLSPATNNGTNWINEILT